MLEIMVFTAVLVDIAYPKISTDAFHSRLGSVKLVGGLSIFQAENRALDLGERKVVQQGAVGRHDLAVRGRA